MRAAIYARVSTEEQVDGYSLDAQVAAMRSYCQTKGWPVVSEFIEAGASARTDQRPQFQAMISQAKAHAFDVILVHKLDRFTRNREDAVTYKSLLRKHGIQLVSTTEPIEDGPMGQLVEGMLEVVAQWYSANLGQEVSKGKRERVAQGLHPSKVPYGYRISGDSASPATIQPEEAEYVRKVFTFYATGEWTCLRLAQWLNENNQRTRSQFKGSCYFTKQAVRRMLGCLYYAGKIQCEDKIYQGRQPAIIEEGLWQRCQLMLHQHSQRPAEYKAAFCYELSGILVCDECGEPMYAHSTNHGRSKKIRQYRCSTHTDLGTCNQRRSANADKIEAEVSQRLAMMKDEWKAEIVRRLGSDDTVSTPRDRAAVERRLERAKDLYLDGEIDKERYTRLAEAARKDLEALEPSVPVDMAQIDMILAQPAEMWAKATPEERKQRNKLMLQEVRWRDGQIVAIKLRSGF